MKCQSCGKRAATVYFKSVVNGKVTELNLCAPCAQKQGALGSWGNLNPLGLDLAQFMSAAKLSSAHQWPRAKQLPSKTTQSKCPQCGTTFNSLKSTGFAGCPACYEAFYPAMKEILKKIHGSSSHKIKKAPTNKEEMTRLKRELDRAVKSEHYEEAAQLRDKLRVLEEGR